MSNTKLNVYKKVLQEVCEKFNGAEEYIKERIEVLCSKSKLSAEAVTYFLRIITSFVKILQAPFGV